MAKQIHFTAGLPRACSTLLQQLLAQNPRIHATATSPLHEIGYLARQVFQTDEAKSVTGPVMESLYFSYVRGGCESAFDGLTDRPVVVDKCRSYLGHLDQLFAIWPNAKVLVPVRDVRGILSSLEKKRRQHPSPMHGFEQRDPSSFTTIEKRVQGWLSSPPVGIAIERLHDSLRFKDRLCYVHAESLTVNPVETMAKVWSYLGEESFVGDFTDVKQYTNEVEMGWPYGDHMVRSQVKPLVPDWDEVLGREMSDAIDQKFGWINQL